MPKVGKKHYAYTQKGRKDAAKAAKRTDMKMTVGRMKYKQKR